MKRRQIWELVGWKGNKNIRSKVQKDIFASFCIDWRITPQNWSIFHELNVDMAKRWCLLTPHTVITHAQFRIKQTNSLSGRYRKSMVCT